MIINNRYYRGIVSSPLEPYLFSTGTLIFLWLPPVLFWCVAQFRAAPGPREEPRGLSVCLTAEKPLACLDCLICAYEPPSQTSRTAVNNKTNK